MNYNRKTARVLFVLIWIVFSFTWVAPYEAKLFICLLMMMIAGMYLYGEIFCVGNDESVGG